MERDDLVYVGHMLDMARKALELAQGKSRNDIVEDDAISLALIHLLQVIGEAARRVSKEFAEQHPEIPWRAIIGMRHKVVHDYMSVDLDVVWSVVSEDLQPLVMRLSKLVP